MTAKEFGQGAKVMIAILAMALLLALVSYARRQTRQDPRQAPIRATAQR